MEWSAATVPPVTFTWYQRGAAKPVVFARRTVCGIQSDSAPPKFVYWFCIIARICNESSRFAVPDCGTLATAAFGQAGGGNRNVRAGEGRQRDAGPVDVKLVDRKRVE